MELVHTLNRGVDRRDIFLDDQDRFRFVHDLFEFNDQKWVNTTFYAFNRSNDIACRYSARARDVLVKVHAFCLMPNHYHLLLSPCVENGISRFMKKLNMGYAKYFNEKYHRVGGLFQGRYKAVRVTKESHFIHLPFYIHLNPLDRSFPTWREGKIPDVAKAMDFLESYRWSSFMDYTGVNNFPSVTDRSFLMTFFGGPVEYKRGVVDWLSSISLNSVEGMLLEN